MKLCETGADSKQCHLIHHEEHEEHEGIAGINFMRFY
jgi:hypothetical protein